MENTIAVFVFAVQIHTTEKEHNKALKPLPNTPKQRDYGKVSARIQIARKIREVINTVRD